jgi:putative transposase
MMPGRPATPIDLSTRQQELLERICRRRTSPQQQVRRAKLILGAASGASNKEIAQSLGFDRNTVRLWRGRWAEAASELAEIEGQAEDKELLAAIEAVLCDAYRSGTPPKFSAEQVVQIIALACEAPSDSKRPVSHWTPKELAAEAANRKIVKSISPQSVERFLKGSRVKAAAIALLAEQQQS